MCKLLNEEDNLNKILMPIFKLTLRINWDKIIAYCGAV
jgi:hypothetical protein